MEGAFQFRRVLAEVARPALRAGTSETDVQSLIPDQPLRRQKEVHDLRWPCRAIPRRPLDSDLYRAPGRQSNSTPRCGPPDPSRSVSNEVGQSSDNWACLR